MSTTDDDDRQAYGPGSFVHLDVTSSYSRLASPNSPLEYVTALTRQFPLNDRTPVDEPRPAIALADYGLQSAVKMAVACARAGVEHLCGLRLRLVPEASWHPWAERPCELLLLAGDEEAWLSLVALHNRGHLSGADFRGPRLDLQDLEELCRGELICLTGPPLVGVLSTGAGALRGPVQSGRGLAAHAPPARALPGSVLPGNGLPRASPREGRQSRADGPCRTASTCRWWRPMPCSYARRQDAQAAAVLDAMRANRRAEDAARSDRTPAVPTASCPSSAQPAPWSRRRRICARRPRCTACSPRCRRHSRRPSKSATGCAFVCRWPPISRRRNATARPCCSAWARPWISMASVCQTSSIARSPNASRPRAAASRPPR